MSNLPAGVTVDMLPGNTPEDEAWDEMLAELEEVVTQILVEWEEKTDERWSRIEIIDALTERIR